MLQTLPIRVLRKGECGLQACRMLVESCTLKGARGSDGGASLRSLCLVMDLCDYPWRKYFSFGEELRKGGSREDYGTANLDETVLPFLESLVRSSRVNLVLTTMIFFLLMGFGLEDRCSPKMGPSTVVEAAWPRYIVI